MSGQCHPPKFPVLICALFAKRNDLCTVCAKLSVCSGRLKRDWKWMAVSTRSKTTQFKGSSISFWKLNKQKDINFQHFVSLQVKWHFSISQRFVNILYSLLPFQLHIYTSYLSCVSQCTYATSLRIFETDQHGVCYELLLQKTLWKKKNKIENTLADRISRLMIQQWAFKLKDEERCVHSLFIPLKLNKKTQTTLLVRNFRVA